MYFFLFIHFLKQQQKKNSFQFRRTEQPYKARRILPSNCNKHPLVPFVVMEMLRIFIMTWSGIHFENIQYSKCFGMEWNASKYIFFRCPPFSVNDSSIRAGKNAEDGLRHRCGLSIWIYLALHSLKSENEVLFLFSSAVLSKMYKSIAPPSALRSARVYCNCIFADIRH